jgi:hydroxymethylpyrimidine pyrophosphatase-like HAD family hydrolase
MKRIVFDIDGTLCEERETFEKPLASPRPEVIKLVNTCKDNDIFVILYTGRSWSEYKITEKWLNDHNVRYDILMCGKPIYDLWIDDRALNPNVNLEKIKERIKNG